MKTGIHVIDAMTATPIVVHPDSTIIACAQLMIKEGVGSVVVQEYDHLVGIVTEKDILRAVAEDRGIDTPVRALMRTNIISIEPHKDIYEALIDMRDNDIRRLPVVHNNKLVGILTQKDILRIEPQLFELIVEKLRIREEHHKSPHFKGRCERCGSLAKLTRHNAMLVCTACQNLP